MMSSDMRHFEGLRPTDEDSVGDRVSNSLIHSHGPVADIGVHRHTSDQHMQGIRGEPLRIEDPVVHGSIHQERQPTRWPSPGWSLRSEALALRPILPFPGDGHLVFFVMSTRTHHLAGNSDCTPPTRSSSRMALSVPCSRGLA